MNAWFPRLDRSGRIASGSAGIWLTDAAGSRQVSPVGTGPAWAGDALAFNRNDGTTEVGGTVVPVAYNELAGSDVGRWAGFDAEGKGRLDVYDGAQRIASEPGICCPRFGGSRFAYLVPYQPGPGNVRSVVLDNVVVATGQVMDVQLSRGGEFYVYLLATGMYTRQIRDQFGVVSIRDDEAPLVAFVGPGGWPWMLTVTGVGSFVRPVGSPLGYLISGELYYPDARMTGGRLRVVGSLHDGTPRFDEWVDFTAPRTDLRTVGAPPVPVEPPVEPPPTTTPPVTPPTGPVDPPKPPAGRFPELKRYVIGGNMAKERGYFIGAEGLYLRGDGGAEGIMGPGTFHAELESETTGEDEEFELEELPDGHSARHVKSGLLLEMDATEYSKGLNRQYYLKGDGGNPPVGYAVLTARLDTDGTVLVWKKYDHREEDKPTFGAAGLYWVKK